MSSNHHDEAGPSFSRLSYEYEWRNECRALSFTANPKKFLNADTFFSSSLELVVLLWVWVQLDESVKSRSTYVAGCIAYFFIVLAREPKRTRLLPTVLDLRPGILPLSNRNQPPLHCARTVERPATSVHRYRFILRNRSNLTTLRGLVRSQSCLERRN